MAQEPLFLELNRLLVHAGIEIRTESFRLPPESAGGLCRIKDRYLVLLHSGASRAERAEALLEVVEHLGLERLRATGSELSDSLLDRLNRRGRMTWSPSSVDTELTQSPPTPRRNHLRIVPSPPQLATLTTLGVGGSPTDFIEADKEEHVVEIVRSTKMSGEALYPLGGGSNLVASDEGVDGTVLKLGIKGLSVQAIDDNCLVTVGAGESWHDFAEQMSREGFAGVECLGGIPGSVGATPLQNVGAYGQEVSQTIESVRVLDRASLKFKTLNKADCKFVYRGSIFKGEARDRFIVLAVTYRLKKGGAPTLRYGELQKRLESRASNTSLRDVFDTVVQLRRDKSMVYDPMDENGRSCGSFFVNAQVPQSTVDLISKKVGEAPPVFEGEKGLIKLPSAWLIERAGFQKGFRLGNAGLSSKHTLAIVAHEGATARDVVGVARRIQETVQTTFGVSLSPEPNFWGFGPLAPGELPPE